MTEATLDGVELSSAVPEVILKRVDRQLLGDRRDIFELVPGRAGSWLFDEQPGDRLIKLELALVGETSSYPVPIDALEARRAACRALAEWADHVRPVKLELDDEPDRYWLSILSSVPTPDEWLIRATVDLEFRSSPFAFANDISTEALVLASGVTQSFDIDDLVNAYPIIELTATSTMGAGFTLDVNGLELEYGAAFASGSKLSISSLSYTVETGAIADTELEGTFVPAHLSMALVDGDFPILVPGTNVITLTGGGASASINWRRRYR